MFGRLLAHSRFGGLALTLGAAALLPAAGGAAEPGIPHRLDQQIPRWFDVPSEALEPGGPHVLRPGSIILRAPIRAVDGMILSHPIEFGAGSPRYRLPAGTRFHLYVPVAERGGMRTYCTYPQSAVGDAQLHALLAALAPEVSRDEAGTQTICLSDVRPDRTFNLLTVSAVMRGRRFLIPNRTYPIRVSSAILRHEPDRARIAGQVELSYRLARAARPQLQLTITNLGQPVPFETIEVPTLFGTVAVTPSFAIDPDRLPMSIAVGGGQLTISSFDRESGSMTVTVDRPLGFGASRLVASPILFRME